MTSPTNSLFSTLRSARIISTLHYRQAQDHPELHALAADASLTAQVEWLVEQGIVGRDELKEAAVHVAASFAGDDRSRYEEAIAAGLHRFAEFERINQPALDALVDEGLLTQDERERALAGRVPDGVRAMEPGAWLIWLTLTEVITMARLNEIRATASPADSARRAAILAEVAQHDRNLGGGGNGAASSSEYRSAVRTMWAGFAVMAAIVGFGVWTWFGARSAPSCTDSDVARGLNAAFMMAQIKHNVSTMMRPDAEREAAPRLADASEIGYASGPRIRACKASLKFGDEAVPYAFTIEPVGENQEFVAMGADLALVQARFSHIDAEGNFAELAQPIGRAALATAMRAGAERLRSIGNPYAATSPPPPAPPPPPGPERREWERKHEIAEVEPMGPCRALTPGKVIRCPLLVERNDRLLEAIGFGGSATVSADFTFARGADGSWATTDAFAEEYAMASASGRMKSIGR